MSFQFPELIVESIIRDGLANIKAKPTILNDVFSSLLANYNTRKYGLAELAKLRTMITTKQVGVVFSYHEVQTTVPCYSIMLGSDNEDRGGASLGDHRQDVMEDITDSSELVALVKASNLMVVDFDFIQGEVEFEASADLSQVTQNNLLVSSEGNEYRIIGIVNNSNKKSVFIDMPNNISEDEFLISDIVEIKSSLDFRKFEIHGVHSDVNLVIGVHSKDALTTKYLYMLLKYFILSRKQDLINRNFIVASYTGSDFTRDQAYQADRVFTRFLTLTGKVEDSWKQSEVDLIENIEIITQVPPSTADQYPQTAESLNEQDQTIQIGFSIDSEDP